jgi:hypothetical protein
MKLPNEVLEQAQIRQLTISCLKMINGLLAFTYIAIFVWIAAQVVQMITG